MNPLLMFRNLQKAAVKTFACFSNELLMVFNLQEGVLKPYINFPNEILIFCKKREERGV